MKHLNWNISSESLSLKDFSLKTLTDFRKSTKAIIEKTTEAGSGSLQADPHISNLFLDRKLLGSIKGQIYIGTLLKHYWNTLKRLPVTGVQFS